jgi:hypothetical protein
MNANLGGEYKIDVRVIVPTSSNAIILARCLTKGDSYVGEKKEQPPAIVSIQHRSLLVLFLSSVRQYY